MFRREWRQQLLVVTLLTVAVAAAVGSITIAYNTSPADNAELGSADHLLRFDGSRSARAARRASPRPRSRSGRRRSSATARWPSPAASRRSTSARRTPDGAYGGELLALRRGRYPTGPREVAVTDGVAELLRLELGSTLALDGRRRTVVGIVENPRKLSDEFALVVSVVRGRAGPRHGAARRERASRSTPSSTGRWASGSAFTGSEERRTTGRRTRWRCSPWPPSSSSWPR